MASAAVSTRRAGRRSRPTSRLAARLPAHPALSLDNIDAQFRQLERGLEEEQKQRAAQDNQHVQAIEECFRAFWRRWPQDSGDFTPTLDSVDGFLARLRRLELDGLPTHEARFFDLLQSQSKQDLLRSGRLPAQRPACNPFPQVTAQGLARHGSGSKGKAPLPDANGSLPFVLHPKYRIFICKISLSF